jgi:hypothetical protein
MTWWQQLPPFAQGVIGLGLLLLLLEVVVDLLPGRFFYSRRAFEPPVQTWAEQQQQRREPLQGELRRPTRELELPPH